MTSKNDISFAAKLRNPPGKAGINGWVANGYISAVTAIPAEIVLQRVFAGISRKEEIAGRRSERLLIVSNGQLYDLNRFCGYSPVKKFLNGAAV